MKYRIAVIVLMLSVAGVPQAQHAPGDGAPYVDFGVDLQAHTRAFLDFGDLDLMAEYVGRYDSDQRFYDAESIRLYNSFTTGAYYRVIPNLKIGLFYRLQLGARHDEDWVDGGAGWEWLDTTRRPEHVLIADATPRFLVPFLPGGGWVFSAKSRYEVTLYEQDGALVDLHSLLIRPGLTWFMIRDREPLLNVSLQYGLYVPLNFSESFWYEQGPYLNVLYHISPALSVDLGLAYKLVYWSESSDFDAAWPNNRYARPIYQHGVIDLGLIYSLDL